jgi:hypothetical protein
MAILLVLVGNPQRKLAPDAHAQLRDGTMTKRRKTIKCRPSVVVPVCKRLREELELKAILRPITSPYLLEK